MELTRFNCFIGTARGFLLSTTNKPKEVKLAKPEFSSEVSALTFGHEEKQIIVGYKNGTLHRYDPSENVYLDTIDDLEGEGSVVGLGVTEELIIAGKSDGVINIWKGNKNKNKHFSVNLSSEGTVNSMVLNETRRAIGTGGNNNDLKLWDLETQQCIFKAKSLGHDKLNLPIPTSIGGILFFSNEPNLSCCCTKEGNVLLYDDRQQRRPVVKFLETKASYTSIASAHRERQCLVGTTKGYMQLLDIRAGKCLKTITSFTGSVTSIACDSVQPYVVSTSLDRHLRLHNLETKELLQKMYLKVNLTCLLLQPSIKKEKTDDDTNNNTVDKTVEDVDDEYENIFESMEIVVDKVKNKKSSKRNTEEDNINIFENSEILSNEVKKKKKSKRNIDDADKASSFEDSVHDEPKVKKVKKKKEREIKEVNPGESIAKKSKKKVNTEDETKQIKTKRKSLTKVKNIFAK